MSEAVAPHTQESKIPMSANPIIDIRNLCMRFGSGEKSVVALDNISLSVAEREFFAIVGHSGCGKSTLLLLIAGLVTQSEGTLLVNGRVVEGPCTNLGIAFQQHNLLAWRTALKNVILPLQIRGMLNRALRTIL